MGESEHIDLDEEAKKGRKGWFVKEADDMPRHKKYQKSCSDSGHGFLGPNFGAHHVLPKEAFDKSVETLKSPLSEIVPKVMFITPFILNEPDNMIGLPSFWSYDAWYTDHARRYNLGATTYPGESRNWKSSYGNSTRKKWAQWIARSHAGVSKKAHPPDPSSHPVHLPVSWGHLRYTGEVTKKLKGIWQILNEEKDKHQIKRTNFEKVKSNLKAAEKSFMTKLKTRGATSFELWEKRKVKSDDSWFGPYTMTDIDENPIWK